MLPTPRAHDFEAKGARPVLDPLDREKVNRPSRGFADFSKSIDFTDPGPLGISD
jgi:hypothetical protein